MELSPDGTAVFRRPDGRLFPPCSPPPPLPPDPVEALREQHRDRGLEIDARTIPRWNGDPYHVQNSLDVLFFRGEGLCCPEVVGSGEDSARFS